MSKKDANMAEKLNLSKTGNGKKRRSLKSVIAIPVISFIIGIILLFAAFGAFMTYRSTIDCLQSAMESEASVAAKTVEYNLSKYTSLAEEISSERRIYQDEYTDEEKAAFISEKADQYGLYNAYILNTRGVDISNGTSYADTDNFKVGIKGESYISSPFTDDATGDLVLTVSAPIWKDGTSDSTVIGVACFTASQSIINEFVESVEISKGGYAYIIDKSGYTIADPDTSNIKGKENIEDEAKADSSLAANAAIHTKARNGESGFSLYKYEGANEFNAYTPIDNTDGWCIFIVAPQSDFTGKVMTTIYLSIIFAILFIAAGVVGTFYIARRVADPIKGYVDRLSKLAEGDVNSPMPELDTSSEEFEVLQHALEDTLSNTSSVIDDIDFLLTEFSSGNFDVFSKATEHYVGDYKHILSSFRTLKRGLTESFQNILQVSEQVSAGSSQVSFGAQSLAQGATEQASSVEELSASIQDISQRVKANAEDAEKAKTLTAETEDIMQSSVGDMNLASQAMDEISDTSKNISKVIKTIDDIAFQTNILALNAAVEAARAGAAGKGFAVVADEVRNLSQKSAEAAKNTTVLIESSINAVEKGTSLVNKTSVGFAQVAQKASEIVSLVDDISTQAQEQSAAISQISIGIEQVSSVVQMNSATSEESAAASEELSSQAEVLKGLVDQFKLATSYHEDT